jgi:hypothetical protein
MIVLRGVIGADGAISQIEVYRGLLPQMDSMALAASSQVEIQTCAPRQQAHLS